MKYLVSSIFIGISNIIVMRLHAQGKFGQTPVELAAILTLISLIIFGFLVAKIIKKKEKKKSLLCILTSAGIWLFLAIFNFYEFKQILYVA